MCGLSCRLQSSPVELDITSTRVNDMLNRTLSLLIASSLYLYASPALAGPTTDMKDGVAQGRSALVEQAILKGADVNAEMDFGSHTDYVLPWAAHNNNLKLVMLLVEKGAKVDQAGYNGRALPHAIRHGNLAMVKYLVEHQAVIDQACLLSSAAVTVAETQAVFAYLLNQKTSQAMVAATHYDLLTKLVESGHTDNLLFFMKQTDITKVEDKVWSELLPLAANFDVKSHVEPSYFGLSAPLPSKLSLMLEEVGLSHFSQKSLATSLKHSVEGNQPEPVQMLLKTAGDKLGQQGLEQAFVMAANKGYGDLLKILAAYSGQIKVSKATQETAFIQSVASGQGSIAAELLDQAGPVGFPPETWVKALAAASQLDWVPGLKWLQENGGKHFDAAAYSHALFAACKAWQINNVTWILEQRKGQWGVEQLAKALSQAVKAENRPTGDKNQLYQTMFSSIFSEGKSELAIHPKVIQLVLPDQEQPILDGYMGVALLEILVTYGFDLNRQNKAGKTMVMHYSQPEIRYDDLQIYNPEVMLYFLISQKGHKVNQQDKDGRSELMYLIGRNDIESAKTLLSQGANLNHTDKQGASVLYYAVHGYGNVDTLIWLFDQGLRDNTPLDKLLSNQSLDSESRLLILKKRLGNNFAQYRDNEGRTMLQMLLEESYIADKAHQLDVIKQLLALKADVNAKDKKGITPWLRVKSKGIAEQLLNKGAVLNSTLPDGRSLLHLTLERGAELNVNWDKGYSNEDDSAETLELALFLVNKGANVLLADKQGHRPMDVLLDSLVQNVSQVEGYKESKSFKDGYGASLWPLYRQLADLLLRQGAVMQPSQARAMALFKVGLYGDTKFLPWFKTMMAQGHFKIELREEFDPDFADYEYNRTPLLIAADSDNIESITYLLSQGADINAQDSKGKTPLITAVKFKNFPVLKHLLQNKPRLDIKDKNGLTALGWAIKLDDDELIQILRAAGATS